MRLFVRGLIEQSNKFELPLELVMVEWNPLPDKEPLSDVLPAVSEDDYLKVKYIQVPAEIHNKYRFSKEIPLYQMIGKNVGIRRAEGEFVICTNVDLLFSDELFIFFKSAKLDTNSFYRCNRCEIPADIDESKRMDEILNWAEKNIMSRLGSKALFPNLNKAFNSIGLYPTNWAALNWLLESLLSLQGKKEDYRLFRLDTYACGDFTMMSRSAWEAIGGYYEADMYSIHIDSLGLICANSIGMEQQVLPPKACTYHIYHESGWASMNAIQKLKFLEQRPGFGWEVIHEIGVQGLKSGKLPNLNDKNWGLDDKDLPEVKFNY